MNNLVRRLTRFAGLAVWSLAAIGALTAPAATLGPLPRFGQTTVFRYLLGQHVFNLEAVADVDQIDEPEHTIVIAFGDTATLGNVPHGLDEFLRKGGALLIATERRTSDPVEQVLGIGVAGLFVQAPGQADQYRGKVECPLVQKVDRNHPIFKDVTRIATNVPSYLVPVRQRGPGQATLARMFKLVAEFPPVIVKNALVKNFPLGWWHASFAMTFQGPVSEDDPESRILVLSDEDVFSDGMMIQPDNDNFDFAYNCLKWLSASGQRTKVLFLDQGEPVTDLDVPLQWVPEGGPLPNMPTPPVEVINEAIAGIEDENLLNATILSNVPGGLATIMRVLAVLLTTGLAVFGLARMAQARYRIEPAAPLFTTTVAKQAPAVTVMDQRQQAMLATDNLWEAARDQARHAFESVAIPPGPEPIAGMLVLRRLRVRGDWWRRWLLRQRVRRLWKLGFGSSPRRVSRWEFARLVEWSSQIRAALDAGTVHLEVSRRA